MRRPSYPSKMDIIGPAVLIAIFTVGNLAAWRYARTTHSGEINAIQDPVAAILATPELLAIVTAFSALVAVKTYREIAPSGQEVYDNGD